MKRYIEVGIAIVAVAVVTWVTDRVLDKLFGCPCGR